VVLLQKGRGGGLGAAFGAGAGSAFGTKTGDVLTWVTIALTVLFLGLTLLSVVAIKPTKMPSEMPAFNPEHPITERTFVQITCPTAKAAIHFTTDGSEPNEKSSKYNNSAIRIRPGQTLKAIAYATGMTPSPVKSYTYLTPEDAARQEAEKAQKAAEEKAETTTKKLPTDTTPEIPVLPAAPATDKPAKSK
ncbi:MAG TPA: preprotein translocase subunit SecG, partial [Phycisphaerae bacterium]|nr:preprotein translocase subunit SecG [Phycisphaerae bacterium]